MIMTLELVGGLIYLLLAGDLLVRGSVALARRADISPVVVGLTVVAFGTSAPELFVSVSAAVQGHPGIAIGNVVGSNIANVLLVLGLPAIILPTAASRESIRFDAAIMFCVSVAFAVLCWFGPITPIHGIVLLSILAWFLVRSLRRSRPEEDEPDPELERLLGLPTRRRMITTFLVAGAIGLPVGAYLMVDGAVQIARSLGVSDAVIGVSVVALGTSLPELATTLIAAIQRQSDVALGNILGSNLFNILAILGVTALVAPSPLPIPPGFLGLDIPVMLFAAGVLTWLAWNRGAVGRAMGAVLLMGYVSYITALYQLAPATGAVG